MPGHYPRYLLLLLFFMLSLRTLTADAVEVADDSIKVDPLAVAFKLANSIVDPYYASAIDLHLAEAYFDIGQESKFEAAIDTALSLARTYPDSFGKVHSLMAIAETLLDRGEKSRALSLLSEAIKNVGATDKASYIWLARDFARGGEYAKAETVAMLIQNEWYSRIAAFEQIAEQYIKRGQLDSALSVYERASREIPNAKSEYLAGQKYIYSFDAHNMMGDSAGAAEFADSILKYDTTRYYRPDMATELETLGKVEEARKIVDHIEMEARNFKFGDLDNNLIRYAQLMSWLAGYYFDHEKKTKAFELLNEGLKKAFADSLMVLDFSTPVTFARKYADLGDTAKAEGILNHCQALADSTLHHSKVHIGTGWPDATAEAIIRGFIDIGNLEKAGKVADPLSDAYLHGGSFFRSQMLAEICEAYADRGDYTKALTLARESDSFYLQAETITYVCSSLFKAGKNLSRGQADIIKSMAPDDD